jgi:hypothetical protein
MCAIDLLSVELQDKSQRVDVKIIVRMFFVARMSALIDYNVLRPWLVGLPKHQLSQTTNVYLKILKFISERK